MFPPNVKSASEGSAHLLNMCDFILRNTLTKSHFADPSERAVWYLSLAVSVGSNLVGVMDVCLL
jgi:hypothetical protein